MSIGSLYNDDILFYGLRYADSRVVNRRSGLKLDNLERVRGIAYTFNALRYSDETIMKTRTKAFLRKIVDTMHVFLGIGKDFRAYVELTYFVKGEAKQILWVPDTISLPNRVVRDLENAVDSEGKILLESIEGDSKIIGDSYEKLTYKEKMRIDKLEFQELLKQNPTGFPKKKKKQFWTE